MKNNRTIKACLFMIFFVWVCSNLKADDALLKLEINYSKDSYLLSEPIWLDLTLSNVSEDTVRIIGPCVHCGDTRFVVVSSKGDTLTYRGIEAEVAYGSGSLLDPSEKKYNCFNFLDYYGERESILRLKLKPDRYTVHAIYYGSKCGKITSNKTTFKVTEVPEVELQPLKLLKQGYSAQISKSPNLSTESFEQIINQFPQSVYAELASKELASTDSLKMEMLKKYPDSGFTKWILSRVTSKMTAERKRNLLQKVIKDFPNTRAAKFAEKMFKTIEDEK
ncbi:MAG: hypothetical protein ACFFDI_26075 [Promethearchaeota archaeon]